MNSRIVPPAARLVAALVGGVTLYLASSPRELWWLAPVSLALLVVVLCGRSARAGFGYGLLFGVAYLLPLLAWLYDFLGPELGLAMAGSGGGRICVLRAGRRGNGAGQPATRGGRVDVGGVRGGGGVAVAGSFRGFSVGGAPEWVLVGIAVAAVGAAVRRRGVGGQPRRAFSASAVRSTSAS